MAAGAATISCFALLVLALAAGAVALVVVSLLRRNAARDGLMSCGQCGYAVRGLTTFTCPECGADLREVGIVRPTRRRWPTVVGLVGAAVLLLVVLMGFLWKSRHLMPAPPVYQQAVPRTTPRAVTPPVTQPAPSTNPPAAATPPTP